MCVQLANVDDLVNKTCKMQLDGAAPSLVEAIEKLKVAFPITEAPQKAAADGAGTVCTCVPGAWGFYYKCTLKFL
jgi:hypothetical protein